MSGIRKMPADASRLRRLLAHGFHVTTFGSGGVLAAVTAWTCLGGLPALGTAGSAALWLYTLISVALAFGLGWFLGAVMLWPFAFHLSARLNRAPFGEGDMVRVLSGPFRGRVARVYEVWAERGQVRVDLGEREKADTADVFQYNQVCRER